MLSQQTLIEEIAFLRHSQRMAARLAQGKTPLNGSNEIDRPLPPNVKFPSELVSLLFSWCRAVCSFHSVQVWDPPIASEHQ